ncbi:MAG: exodeoxyribonuclease VII large subunit [Anaeroplasmataceae bacterium]|nr:exodeoxyribonuclease VII large subunit [Anaeroplasmataceae bacterium]MDE7385319.1 exodeoxyribonuclease VII large subunit [Anaeroplasmataceae bacterium]
MEERYLTVTALTKYIKYKFDHDHHLEEVLLEGEISNFKHNSRGHFYFTLKDENASISVTMFSSFARLVKFEPKDGMKVFVKGNVTVYEPSGTYQINIREMKSDGVGDLYLAFQKLKAELEKEGLFDPEHKQKLPLFPQCIGVVTSPTGAAIKDIIHTVGRRYPLTRIILYPAIVQGEDAKDNVVEQIELANEQGLCDVLIVGRGGGSIEDLWAFNERCVAMAIYNSRIPIISAVGHEIDFTIADFVADVRAATPTAAAELATPSLEMLKGNVAYYVDRMTKHMKQIIENARLHIANMDRRIDSLNPMSMLEHKKRILKEYTKQLTLLIQRILLEKKSEFKILDSKLGALNPLAIMDKGYSINSVDGVIITDVTKVKKDDILTTKMKNGEIKSKILEVKTNGN